MPINLSGSRREVESSSWKFTIPRSLYPVTNTRSPSPLFAFSTPSKRGKHGTLQAMVGVYDEGVHVLGYTGLVTM